MFKLKKETQFILIALFAFLLLFEIFGYDFGTITGGAATSVYFGDLGTIMNEALTLPFESLVKPFFTTVFGSDYYIYSIKILLIVVLSIIFNLGTSLLFAYNKKSARWIAIIFATLGVVLIPAKALEALFGTAGGEPSFIGSLILALVILAFIIGIFVPLFKWKAQGMGNNILRGIAFLVMIPLISWARATFAGFILGGGPSFFSLVLSLISLICLIMFFVSLVRAFSGGVREATGGDLVEGARRARENIGRGREAWGTLFGRRQQQPIGRSEPENQVSRRMRVYILNIQRYGNPQGRNIGRFITNLKALMRELPSIANQLRYSPARLIRASNNIFRDGNNANENDIQTVISETKTFLAALP